MRLIVVADTHLPRKNRDLPREILEAVERADRIAHLGDFTAGSVLTRLQQFAPVHAVHGNNDDPDVVALLPAQSCIELCGRAIVLLHGHVGGATALQAARRVRGADIVLFGHSHRVYNQFEGGRLLFNPGSATASRWSSSRSFGIIDIDDQLRASVVTVD